MFADRLHLAIKQKNCPIIAGIDPRLDDIPAFIREEALSKSSSDEEFFFRLINSFYSKALEVLSKSIPAIKPNIAYFEQYGLGGLRAFKFLCEKARDLGLIVIADVKRGDIGPSAQAYAQAYLCKQQTGGRSFEAFFADAITVNPFLGFDTLDPFLESCIEHKKGMFVLVRTSNPGSSSIQDHSSAEGQRVSEKIAAWIGEKGKHLEGSCKLSGLGAVIGATYPKEAETLRKIMPKAFFLIPGFGAQGAKAKDALAGFVRDSASNTPRRIGGLINVSRALFGSLAKEVSNSEELEAALELRFSALREDLKGAGY